MKDLILLTKVSLGATFNFNKLFKKRNLRYNIKKLLGIIGAILVTLIVLASAYLYSYGIGSILAAFGQVDILPELVMAVVSIFVVVTTISRVKGTLFGFKDYDLIMSLPVAHNVIVASRLLTLYIINLAFTLIIMVPSSIAYIVLVKPGAGFYIYTILSLVFVPIVPMIIGTVLGTIIAYVSSKFRRNNFVNLLLYFLLVAGVFLFSMVTSSSEEAIGQSAEFIRDKVSSVYPLSWIYRDIVIDYDILSLLLFIFISLVFLVVYVVVIGRKFKEINTSITSIRTSTKRRKRNYSLSSPIVALYKKELSRYFSSPLYVLNTGIGMIMLLIGAIATLFVKSETIDQLLEMPGFSELAGTYLPMAIPFFVVMVYTSACSISLEGNNLWIIKSIPISTKGIFLSKIGVNLTVILPLTLLSIVLLSMGLSISPFHALITAGMAIVYAFLTSFLGLLINLLFPVFDWKTEVTVVKQSLSAFLAMIGGLVTAFIPIGGHYLLSDLISPTMINLILIGLVGLIDLIIYLILIKVGTRIFRQL